MRKVLLVFTLFITIFLSGCFKDSLKDLNTHLLTTNDLNSYVIKMEARTGLSLYTTTNESYIFVDNVNERMKVSSENLSDVNKYSTGDILMDISGDPAYGYIKNTDYDHGDISWHRYAISDAESSTSFEASIITYFEDEDKTELNGGNIYSKEIRIEDLHGDLFDLLSEMIDEEYHDIFITLEATFKEEEAMFTEVSIEMNRIFQRIYKDEGIADYGSARWEMSYIYELDRLNEPFTILFPEYTEDDHVGTFEFVEFFDFETNEFTEMFEGTLEVAEDIDIFQIDSDSIRRYKLNLTSSITSEGISVLLLDEDYQVVFQTIMNSDEPLSEEFLVGRGTYYFVVYQEESFSEDDNLSYAFTFVVDE